ncbi:MAG TPA: hypothetical protein VMB81_15095 [Candidatus Sulfotelmatobacter sp.]|nr:hypothetical protein [Candidatus Sulfotelmatobacter sp.]
MSRLAIAATLLFLSMPAFAGDDDTHYATEGGHVICTTQQALRDAQDAISSHSKKALDQIEQCKISKPGLRAEKLVDGMLSAKFRIYDEDGKATDYWTSPTTMKEVRR